MAVSLDQKNTGCNNKVTIRWGSTVSFKFASLQFPSPSTKNTNLFKVGDIKGQF